MATATIPVQDSLGTCVVCAVRTYPSSTKPEIKDVYRSLGWKRKGGRGACANCFGRFSKAGRLNELAFVRGTTVPGDPLAKACTRCGIDHRMPEPLCQDCNLVTADLGESEVWIG